MFVEPNETNFVACFIPPYWKITAKMSLLYASEEKQPLAPRREHKLMPEHRKLVTRNLQYYWGNKKTIKKKTKLQEATECRRFNPVNLTFTGNNKYSREMESEVAPRKSATETEWQGRWCQVDSGLGFCLSSTDNPV